MIPLTRRNAMRLMILCSIIPVLGFGQGGSIRGVLTQSNGTPIADFPIAVSLVPPSIPDNKYEPWTRTAFTNADGGFSLAAIPDGNYRICPQKNFVGHINPCAWSQPPAPIKVSSGQVSILPIFRLPKAQLLQVRVEDPVGLLAQARVPDRGGPVVPSRNGILLGVFTSAGYFIPGRLTTDGGNTKSYSIEVPESGKFQFSAASTTLQLLDGAGQRIEASRGHSVAVEATAGKTLDPIVVRIQGLLLQTK
ncbi:MAG: carboxypeptidase-like regulatory domain-containing protein [Verrucomicrobia bacterium]|nr:carboxypeptidase-like regulatory domain-containing protein [Verrucomicrobiota bacterium]